MNTQMKNTLCSLLQHLCTILCGLILPREILIHYGSDMNGLVLSITRFLSYTALLELGIGAVIPAALYSPLAVRVQSCHPDTGYSAGLRESVWSISVCFWAFSRSFQGQLFLRE